MSNDILKRGRGRPRKVTTELKTKRPRGRPVGSKSKHSSNEVDTSMHDVSILNSTETVLDSTVGIEGGIGTMSWEVGNVDSSTPNLQNFSTKSDISNNHEVSNDPNDPSYNDISNDITNYNDIVITPDMVMEARRRLALSSLKDFACMIDIPDTPIDEENTDAFSTIKLDSLAQHHELMCNEMQKLVDLKAKDRSFDNLMFFMPPGSAKSTYADVVFPAWFMAKYPRKQVLLACYGDVPAQNQARKTKSLVNSADYAALFPNVRPSKDRTAVDDWALSNGSSYLSRGLFGEITSRRSDLGLIDDPVKGAEEADSETMQRKTYDAYEKNFCTRLKPGAPQILIMTRWNENDLAGKILPEGWDGESGDFIGRDGRRWRVICLPAIADRDDDPLNRKIGDSIWPEWFGIATGNPLDHWGPFRLNSRTWNSLYQQKPTADDGDYFIRANFKRCKRNELPEKLRYYGTSDYAVTEGKGDYTVLRIWGIDDSVEPAQLYLIDGWKGKTKSNKWIKEQCNLIQQYAPAKWFGEAGAIQKAIEPSLIETMREMRIMCNIIWMPSTLSKEIRARPAQMLVQEQRVTIIEGVDYDDVITEYIKFPTGKHDDDVDCLSLIGRAIDQITIRMPTAKVIKIPPTTNFMNKQRGTNAYR